MPLPAPLESSDHTGGQRPSSEPTANTSVHQLSARKPSAIQSNTNKARPGDLTSEYLLNSGLFTRPIKPLPRRELIKLEPPSPEGCTREASGLVPSATDSSSSRLGSSSSVSMSSPSERSSGLPRPDCQLVNPASTHATSTQQARPDSIDVQSHSSDATPLAPTQPQNVQYSLKPASTVPSRKQHEHLERAPSERTPVLTRRWEFPLHLWSQRQMQTRGYHKSRSVDFSQVHPRRKTRTSRQLCRLRRQRHRHRHQNPRWEKTMYPTRTFRRLWSKRSIYQHSR